MKALKFEGSSIKPIEIAQMDVYDETKALQTIIGGYLEAVRLSEDAVMLVDEEGYCKCLPPNPAASLLSGRRILGTALVVGLAENADGELYFTDCPSRYMEWGR